MFIKSGAVPGIWDKSKSVLRHRFPKEIEIYAGDFFKIQLDCNTNQLIWRHIRPTYKKNQ